MQASPVINEWIREGMQKILPDAHFTTLAISDGGDGLLECLVHPQGGEIVEVTVSDPLLRKTQAQFGIVQKAGQKIAVIEMARASGLNKLKPHERNIMKTTTYGTGELIGAAIDRECTRVILGLGGGATSDGGLGACAALGLKILDKNQKGMNDREGMSFGAEVLSEIEGLEDSALRRKIQGVEIIVLADVRIPLFGPQGVSYLFGPQKGATPAQVELMEKGLKHYRDLLQKFSGSPVESPYLGAAGGIGGSFMALCHSPLYHGIDYLLDEIHFDDLIADADMVVTGEGSLDPLTLFGKAPLGIAQRCKKQGIPVAGIFGRILGDEKNYRDFFDYQINASRGQIVDVHDEKQRMEIIPSLIRSAASELARVLIS